MKTLQSDDLKHNQSIKYILLDVHGVLTDGNERKRFLAKMEETYNIDYDQHNMLWVSHLDELDRGKEKVSEYIRVVNKIFHTHFSPKEYYDLFLQQIVVNKALLRKLHTIKNKIYIVSDNVSGISVGLNNVLGKDFRKYKKFYSCKLVLTKAYGLLQIVVEKLKIKPEECLFIDDNKTYTEAAKKKGIDTMLFRTNKALFSKLETITFV